MHLEPRGACVNARCRGKARQGAARTTAQLLTWRGDVPEMQAAPPLRCQAAASIAPHLMAPGHIFELLDRKPFATPFVSTAPHAAICSCITQRAPRLEEAAEKACSAAHACMFEACLGHQLIAQSITTNCPPHSLPELFFSNPLTLAYTRHELISAYRKIWKKGLATIV